MRRRHLPAVALIVASMISTVHGIQSGDEIFSFTFDSETGKEKGPTEFSFYGEMLRDFGITKLNRLSKPNAAYVVADFAEESWGVIMLSHPGKWNLSDARISIAVRTPDSLHGAQGILGFKLIDADGNEVRTRNEDLYMPSRHWNVFTQKTSDITLGDTDGAEAHVDLENIVRIGVLIFDPPPTDSQAVTKFFLDDFRASR